MATSTTVKKTETKKVFDISDFFTIDAESEGVWFRPTLGGNPVPFEFKVLGKNSDRMTVIVDSFRKKLGDIQSKPVSETTARQERELYAETASERVVGFRFDEGYEVKVDGVAVEYSDAVIRSIFEKAPDLALQVIKFSADSEGFYKKKND